MNINIFITGFILFANLSAMASGYSPQNVFGEDNRKEITQMDRPWMTIGKLIAGNGSYCTATLVSRDIILTAAHCIYEKGELIKGELRFYPAYGRNNGDYSLVTRKWSGTRNPDSNRSRDWAILKLEKSLGDKYGWMGVEGFDGDQLLKVRNYHLGGYSSDFRYGSVGSLHSGCRFTGYQFWTGFSLHNCDMSRGASGAGIFYFKDATKPATSVRIVAINVAEYRGQSEDSLTGIPYDDAHANIAVPASVFVPTLLSILKNP